MLTNANSLGTNVFITALVLVLVVLMPELDLLICRKLRLNLMGGISENPNAGRLHLIRKALILIVFLVYLAGFSYIVFFSRSASEDYQKQEFIITSGKLNKVRKRLQENGIIVGPSYADPYTGKECLSFDGPDNTKVIIIGE
ncbi:MAG: hypothetical protein IKF70_02910 [Firmicutes bacterium]|nr:hypothetical protein [Bacillota bacterium]